MRKIMETTFFEVFKVTYPDNSSSWYGYRWKTGEIVPKESDIQVVTLKEAAADIKETEKQDTKKIIFPMTTWIETGVRGSDVKKCDPLSSEEIQKFWEEYRQI
jgi:hypothetical protein